MCVCSLPRAAAVGASVAAAAVVAVAVDSVLQRENTTGVRGEERGRGKEGDRERALERGGGGQGREIKRYEERACHGDSRSMLIFIFPIYTSSRIVSSFPSPIVL